MERRRFLRNVLGFAGLAGTYLYADRRGFAARYLTEELGVTAMLGRAPALPVAIYANPAAQFAAQGIEPLDDLDDPSPQQLGAWRAVVDVALPIGGFGVGEEFRAAYGFDLLQLDEAVQVGESDSFATFMRGRFDDVALQRAWGTTYLPDGDDSGDTVYVLASEAPSAARYATRLTDGRLLVATDSAVLNAALAADALRAPSFANDPDISAVVAELPSTLASVVLLPGKSLAILSDPSPLPLNGLEFDAETLAASGEMPPVRRAALAFTPGAVVEQASWGGNGATPVAVFSGPGDPARFEAVLLFADRSDAGRAANVVAARIATLQSIAWRPLRYADMFWEWDVRLSESSPAVNLTLGGRIREILDMHRMNDLALLYW